MSSVSAPSTRLRTQARRFRRELLIDLVSAEWVDERKKRWGTTSPIYTSKVLGEFPDISDDTLITDPAAPFTVGDRIKIESKDDMRKRGLPSPDRADTVAQSFSPHRSMHTVNIEDHMGQSITGDLMAKAW
jgi:hypothetical protein